MVWGFAQIILRLWHRGICWQRKRYTYGGCTNFVIKDFGRLIDYVAILLLVVVFIPLRHFKIFRY